MTCSDLSWLWLEIWDQMHGGRPPKMGKLLVVAKRGKWVRIGCKVIHKSGTPKGTSIYNFNRLWIFFEFGLRHHFLQIIKRDYQCGTPSFFMSM